MRPENKPGDKRYFRPTFLSPRPFAKNPYGIPLPSDNQKLVNPFAVASKVTILPLSTHLEVLRGKYLEYSRQKSLLAKTHKPSSAVVIETTLASTAAAGLVKTVSKAAERGKGLTPSSFAGETSRRTVLSMPIAALFNVQKEFIEKGVDPVSVAIGLGAPFAAVKSFQQVTIELQRLGIPRSKELVTRYVKTIFPPVLAAEVIGFISAGENQNKKDIIKVLAIALGASILNAPSDLIADEVLRNATQNPKGTPMLDLKIASQNLIQEIRGETRKVCSRLSYKVSAALVTATIFSRVVNEPLTKIIEGDKKEREPKEVENPPFVNPFFREGNGFAGKGIHNFNASNFLRSGRSNNWKDDSSRC